MIAALLCSAFAALLTPWLFIPFLYLQLDLVLSGPLSKKVVRGTERGNQLRNLIRSIERARSKDDAQRLMEQVEERLDTWEREVTTKRQRTITAVKWILGVLVVMNLLFAIEDDMWLPSERVRTPTSEQIGYVLAETEDDLLMLTEDPRRVVAWRARRIQTEASAP